MNKNLQSTGLPAGDCDSWGKWALKDGLRAVIDPADLKGLKNNYIDTLHKVMLHRYLFSDTNERILDFGCGVGRFTSWLKKRGFKVVGIDITEEMLDVAKRTYPNDVFILYDGTNIPFKNQLFDRILSVYVLQYITVQNDFRKIIMELVKCTKKGGMIYLIEQVSKKYSDYHLHRLTEDYIEMFKECNCKCIFSRPIRNSNSLILEVVKSGFVPKFMFPIVALVNLYFTKNVPIPDKGYLDYFFVFQKEK